MDIGLSKFSLMQASDWFCLVQEPPRGEIYMSKIDGDMLIPYGEEAISSGNANIFTSPPKAHKKNVQALAKFLKKDRAIVSHTLQLALLSPEIMESALITAHVLYGRKHVPQTSPCASPFFSTMSYGVLGDRTVRYNSFNANAGQREKHPGDVAI